MERRLGESAEHEVLSPLELTKVRIERILVAVDFSEASRKAVEYAAVLAKQAETEILLLHVFEGVRGELRILEATYVDTSFREEARANLAKWESELGALGVRVRTVFREGSAIDREIVRAAAESKADLIVIGRHGSQGFFLNNTTKKVLGQAPCPVLVGE